MNLKDKTLQVGGIVFLGSLTGLIFPKLLVWILVLGVLAGMVTVLTSIIKTTRKKP